MPLAQETEKSTPASLKPIRQESSPLKIATPAISLQLPASIGQVNVPTAISQLTLVAPTGQTQGTPVGYLPIDQLLGLSAGQGVLPIWQGSGVPIYIPSILTLPQVPQALNQKTAAQDSLKIKPVIQLAKPNSSEENSSVETEQEGKDKTSHKILCPKPIHLDIKESAFKKVRKA